MRKSRGSGYIGLSKGYIVFRVPKITDSFLRVPIIGIIVFWGLTTMDPLGDEHRLEEERTFSPASADLASHRP